jgi:hypothetical protein
MAQILNTLRDSKLWHNYYLIPCQNQNCGTISIQHPPTQNYRKIFDNLSKTKLLYN